jgi:hypothetical protein
MSLTGNEQVAVLGQGPNGNPSSDTFITTTQQIANLAAGGGGAVPGSRIRATLSADGQVGSIPANAMITGVTLLEVNGHSVTVSLGQTSGASDVLGATAVGANGIVPVPASSLLLQAWASAQAIFVHSASWGSAAVTVTVWYVQ